MVEIELEEESKIDKMEKRRRKEGEIRKRRKKGG